MDNIVLRTATVTRLISNTLVTSNFEEGKTYREDSSALALAEYATFNIDRRTIAIGGSEEIWLFDLMNKMDPSWYEMINSVQTITEMAFLIKNPRKILSFCASIPSTMCLWLSNMADPETELTFVNNPMLDAYEQHMIPISDTHTYSKYSVIDYDDLENGIEDKYDFITAMAWDIVSDPDLQRQAVDALAPGGILCVALTNNGGRLYTDAYHEHPYTEFHENLGKMDGYVYHIPALYAHTLFIKN